MSAYILPEEAEEAIDRAEQALSLVETLAARCDGQLDLKAEELYAFCSLLRERLAAARAAARFAPMQD